MKTGVLLYIKQESCYFSSMEPKLFQQQSQRLILSPQIRQYLKLLQLPVNELEQAVEAELTENPVLEERPSTPAEETDIPPTEKPFKNNEEIKPGESFAAFDRLDENFRETLNYPDFARADQDDMEEKHRYQESLITNTKGLSDYLTWQVRFLGFTERELSIAFEIIGNLDDDGFLRASVEEIALACRTFPAAVEKVLSAIQEIEPAGIAARNLQEALTLQLKKLLADETSREGGRQERISLIEIAIRIVSGQLSSLERRDWSGLAKNLSLDLELIKKASEIIARLDPKPGRSFLTDESHVIVPDAAISFSESEEEKFKVEIHDEKIPEIRINPYYRKLLRTKDLDEKSKTFLKEKIQSALNFIQAIHLRKSTLRDITEEIVKAQPEFLEKGFLHLKPLRLKDIANNLGIHESTVSRAIQGKYVSTPQGVISYKSFFSTRMENTDGEAESQKSLMEKIRFMIDKEPVDKPYSDEQIVTMMNAEGIQIARRTVAKYRDLLKILPSHLRRRK